MQEGNLVAQALDRIDRYLKQTGMKESRLGLLACANARAVQRVRDKTASIETLEHLLAYIEDHPARSNAK